MHPNLSYRMQQVSVTINTTYKQDKHQCNTLAMTQIQSPQALAWQAIFCPIYPKVLV